MASELFRVLRTQRQWLADGGKRVALAFGNEAGDLDTIVSSLALAFLWPRLPGNASTEYKDEQLVPVCPFPRDEFRLRGDAKALFVDMAGFEADATGAPSELLFLDDIDGAEIKPSGLVITDHNEPADSLLSAIPALREAPVIGLVDHHADKQLFSDARLRIVDESCGSATTLVAELALEHDIALPDKLVKLLLCVILLDTRNFRLEGKRHSERDIKTHAALCEKYPSVCGDPSQQAEWYKALTNARKNVDDLDSSDLLKLDFKSSAIGSSGLTLGFCAIMDTFSGLVSRAGSLEALERNLDEFMAQRELAVCLCIHMAQKVPGNTGKHKIVSVIASKDDSDSLLNSVLDIVKGCPDNLTENLLANQLIHSQGLVEHGFGETHIDEYSTGRLRVFTIRNDITRKTVLPIVLDLLADRIGST